MKLPLQALQIPLYIPEPIPDKKEQEKSPYDAPTEYYGKGDGRATTVIRIPMNPEKEEYDDNSYKN